MHHITEGMGLHHMQVHSHNQLEMQTMHEYNDTGLSLTVLQAVCRGVFAAVRIGFVQV